MFDTATLRFYEPHNSCLTVTIIKKKQIAHFIIKKKQIAQF